MLPRELSGDPDRKMRFLQEARAAAAVSHPALAQVYDVDESEEGLFIAMELVPGKTVETLIQARELDLAGALEVGLQVAVAPPPLAVKENRNNSGTTRPGHDRRPGVPLTVACLDPLFLLPGVAAAKRLHRARYAGVLARE